MKELFAKRKQDFRQQCLKYLRYVFNDHFVLFLLIFMGFLGVQYSQLLRHFPTNHLPIIASLVILSLFILPFGRIATYLEKPDALFLLVREAEVRSFYQGSDSTFLSLVCSHTNWNLATVSSAFSGSGIACLGLRALLPPYASLEMVFVSG